MSKKRAEQRELQRTGILDAARTLFARDGFEEVTVADVAEAAGVARATVFNHFHSKSGLVDALREATTSAYRVMLDLALADRSTPTPTLLRSLFHIMGLGIESDRRFYRGVFREMNKVQLGYDEGGPAQRANDELLGRLEQLMESGQKRGELRRDVKARQLALAFTSLVTGTITYWLYTDPSGLLRTRMDEAIEIFLGPVAIDYEGSPDQVLPDLRPPELRRSEHTNSNRLAASQSEEETPS